MPRKTPKLSVLPDNTKALAHVLSAGAWHPIETAPKEQNVLLYIPSDYGAEVGWHDGSEWCCYRGDGVRPTHWQPLPEPPQQQEENMQTTTTGEGR